MSRQRKTPKKPTRTSFLTPQPGMTFLLMDDGDTVAICGVGCILLDEHGDGIGEIEDLEALANHFLLDMGRA